MQFNSYFFILFFLPCVIGGYFLLNKISHKLGKIFLIIMSIWFYGVAGLDSLIILGVSIGVNYVLARMLSKSPKKWILCVGIIINCGLLFVFKYLNFTISSINSIADTDFVLQKLILPLGISFYTFSQIAYLVDSYRQEMEKNDVLEYLLYVLFFPKLLMGPLISPNELIGQFQNEEKSKLNMDNLASGIQMFALGLFKKVMLADTFSRAVTWGFDNIPLTTAADFMIVMLSYTFQIYFDFSGYSDMAIGIARMLNIDLPMNFDSPYKAMSIQDFWKRWHISLTKFLTNYIYIPLGGNRKGKMRTYINVFIVFLVSGIWHGANWTFILWGVLHGLASIIDRIIYNKYSKVHPAVQWIGTFFVVNILWLLFRANSVAEWSLLLSHMFQFNSMFISDALIQCFVLPETSALFTVLQLTNVNGTIRGFAMLLMLLAGFIICLLFENNYRKEHKNTIFTAMVTAAAMTWSLLCLSSESVFVYFNF